MLYCKEMIREYLIGQEKIKKNMNILSNECPDKVLKFLLQKESEKTLNRVINCTWSDNLDKKYVSKILKRTCNDLD